MTQHTLPSSIRSSSDSFRSSQDPTTELAQTKEALRRSLDATEQLRSSLSKLALEKQTLAGQMQSCQASNGRLVDRLALENADFEARTLRMQHEISVIRSNVVDAKSDLVLANSDLRETLSAAARTTMRLSLMFLRMRQAKQRAEQRSRFHRDSCKQFEASVREQATIIRQIRKPFDADDVSETTQLLFDSQQRVGELLQRNASLQIRLAAERVWRNTSRQSRRITRRLLRRLAKELCFETGIPDATGRRPAVFGRQRISRKLRAHIVADPDVTVFEVDAMETTIE